MCVEGADFFHQSAGCALIMRPGALTGLAATRAWGSARHFSFPEGRTCFLCPMRFFLAPSLWPVPPPEDNLSEGAHHQQLGPPFNVTGPTQTMPWAFRQHKPQPHKPHHPTVLLPTQSVAQLKQKYCTIQRKKPTYCQDSCEWHLCPLL